MHPGGSGPPGPSGGRDESALLEHRLDPGETIWAVVPGAGGESLIATDRRLFHLRWDGASDPDLRAWPFEDLGEIRPIGGPPGQIPGRFLIEDFDRVGPRISFAIDPARREDAMQAVTIVQLLIARAHALQPVTRGRVSPTRARRPREPAPAPTREPRPASTSESVAEITTRWADPTTRSPR